LAEALEQRAIGRIEQRHAVEPRLVEHRLLLAEGLEALAAVVMAHAAGADAAEGQVLLGDVQDGVVDGDAAGHGLLQHAVAMRCAVVAEVIQRQGFADALT
jgi:hypothetical protein